MRGWSITRARSIIPSAAGDDLALAGLDAAGVGGCGAAIRLYRAAIVGALRQTGLVMIGLLGAINIPFYEEMARRIHWWEYSGCKMISFTPWYIILGEFGIAVAFAWLARMLRRSSWAAPVAVGIVVDYRYLFGLRSGFSDYRSVN